ncbi:MAG: hypothetical protein DBX47_02205 [Clostridiales bacterium]|nr:MAG: hypothetical protein DBX47_02205 [Clostridiales bacterium]
MQKRILDFLFPAITLLCVFIAVFLPSGLVYLFFPLTLIASLFCAISVALNKSPVLPLTAVFLFLIVLLYTKSASESLFYMCLFLPVGVAVGVGYRYKFDLGKTAMGSIISSSLMLLLMCVSYILEVSPIFSVREALEPFRKMVSSISDGIYSQLSVYASTSVSAIISPYLSMTKETFANNMFISVVYSTPIVIGAAVLLMTVFVYFIMKRAFVRTKNDISFMSSFDTLRVTKTTAVLYMISVLLSSFLSFTSQSTSVYLVIYIFSSTLSFVLAFCGLSVIWYFLKTRDFGKVARVALFIFVIFVCSVITILPSLLAFLGVLDTLTDVRSRFNGRFGI